EPLGGVTVTATDGSTTATETTSTVSPVGSYTLPNLAIPGTWTLTVSGTGWLTQTQEVTLTGNSTVNASLTESGANVIGVVSSGKTGLANVGLTLSNTKTTYKSLSESASPVGGFDFGQIPPGQYVLSATSFGYSTQSASVHVAAGQTDTVDFTLPKVGTSATKNGSITGSVVDEVSGTGIAAVPIDLDGTSTGQSTNSDGVYTISGVSPGLHEVTAEGAAGGYADAGVQVSVAEDEAVTAPIIELPHLSTIKGVVTSQLTGKRVTGATVLLFAAGKKLTTPAKATGTATSSTAGTYSLAGVSAGSYVLEAKKTATGYNPTQIDVTVAAGETPVVQNISLSEGPTYQAKTWYVTSGNLEPLSYVCVLVTGPFGKTTTTSSTKAAITSATNNEVTIPDLKSGKKYKATFRRPTPLTTTIKNLKTTKCPTPTASTGFSYSASGGTFTAKTDNTTVYGAVLAPESEGVTVKLQFPYVEAGSGGGTPGTTHDCPVTTAPSAPCSTAVLETSTSTLPTVSLVGTTGYGTTTGGTPGTPVTTKVAMTHTAGTGTWTLTATSTRFYGTSMTLEVTDPAGQLESLSKTVKLSTSGTTTLTELLTPEPVLANATISPTSGVAISVVPSTLQPTSKVATHTANSLTSRDDITASEGSSGKLTWADPAVRSAGDAQPGSYTLTLSKTGYVTKSVTVTVPLCPTKATCTATVGSFSLSQLVTLKVVPVQITIPSGLTLPKVTLYRGTGTTDQIAQKTLAKTGSTYSASFSSLTPSVIDYRFTVSGPGIETYTSAALALGGAATGLLKETPSLTLDGWLKGTVTGLLVPTSGASQALATAKITATLTGTVPTGSSCQRTLTANSGTSGSYVLIPATGGLCPTKTYTVAVSLHGFTTTNTMVPVSSGPTSKSFTLDAEKVKQTIEVKGVASGVVVKVTATSVIGPTITCTLTVGTTTKTKTAPNTCTTATAYTGGATTGAVFVFTVYPTTYSYSLSAYQYVGVAIGVPAPNPGTIPRTQSYTMSQKPVTIEGTVKVSATGSSSGAKAIATLPLTLDTSNGTTAVATQKTTNSSGTYTFKTVLPGNYQIKVGDGYITLSTIAISTGTGTLVHETFTVYASAKQVKVAVDGASGTGTSVHLTPKTHTPVSCDATNALLKTGFGTDQTATAVTTGSTVADAEFSDVVPDVYKVSVDTPPTTVGTLVVCPALSTTAVTTPATPRVTLPVVTLTSSVSLAYGSETSKTFTVVVTGTTGHGYPKKSAVKLTATGTSKSLTCPSGTVTHTTPVTTLACHATSKEVGVGSYKILFEPDTPSSSNATFFYGPVKSATTVTVTASVPAAPTKPAETAKSGTTVTLSWTAPTSGGSAITGYVVLETGTSITVGGTPRTYQVTGLTPVTTYKFKIEAKNAAGTSTPSPSLSVETTATVPQAPAKPTATSTKTTVTLSWTAPTTRGSHITGYVVLEKESGTFTSIATPTTTSHKVTGLAAGTTYTFEIEAVNTVGTSAASTPVSVLAATLPGAPTTLTVISAGGTVVKLGWTEPSTDGGSTITHYEVLETETESGTPTFTEVGSVYGKVTLAISAVPAGTHTFEVEAVNAKGTSGPSNTVTATTTM
ncbi:MAG: fibronectin type III domain-containing protein, partial [Acidimicrobiales bacterium]